MHDGVEKYLILKLTQKTLYFLSIFVIKRIFFYDTYKLYLIISQFDSTLINI